MKLRRPSDLGATAGYNAPMSRRSRFLLASLAIIAIGLAVGGWLLWTPTAITRENVARIQPGMTREEVHTILGGPPNNEAFAPLQVLGPWEGAPVDVPMALKGGEVIQLAAGPGGLPDIWVGDDLLVQVQFDAAGHATGCRLLPVRRAEESLLAKVRRRLGL
jgi:hypothetical protein